MTKRTRADKVSVLDDQSGVKDVEWLRREKMSKRAPVCSIELSAAEHDEKVIDADLAIEGGLQECKLSSAL